MHSCWWRRVINNLQLLRRLMIFMLQNGALKNVSAVSHWAVEQNLAISHVWRCYGWIIDTIWRDFDNHRRFGKWRRRVGGLCYATNCLNKFGDKVCLLGMEVLKTLGFQGLAAGYLIGGVWKYNAMKFNPLTTVCVQLNNRLWWTYLLLLFLLPLFQYSNFDPKFLL